MYTAEIHRLLGTPVTLDLGTTLGLLADIKTQVLKLDTVVQATGSLPDIAKAAGVTLPGQVEALGAQLRQDNTLVLNAVGNARGDLLAGVHKALDKTADDIVKRVGIARQPFAIGEKAAHLVRLLEQAAAMALDKTPGEPYQPPKKMEWKENIGMDALREAARDAMAEAGLDATTSLGRRVQDAFARFESTQLADRSARFVSIHALIPDLAAAL